MTKLAISFSVSEYLLVFCKRLIGILLVALLVSACTTVTPHENFKLHMSSNVGKKMNDPTINWMRPEGLVESKTLKSGNLENEYRFRGTCRYFFEIDPKTNKIVGWRWEGSEDDCRIVP